MHIPTKEVIAAFSLGTCLVIGATAYAVTPVRQTSICEAVSNPDMFAKRRVRLTGRYVWGKEGTAVVDDSCRLTGVEIWIPKETRQRSDFMKLNHERFKRWKQGADASPLFVAFEGVFSIQVEDDRRWFRLTADKAILLS